MKISKAYLLFPFLFAAACSNSEMQIISEETCQQSSDSTEVEPQDSTTNPLKEIDGMIQLSGGKVTVGSNDKSFKTNERPAMKVVLDYEFFMDIHEVTCGDYDKIAKETSTKSPAAITTRLRKKRT